MFVGYFFVLGLLTPSFAFELFGQSEVIEGAVYRHDELPGHRLRVHPTDESVCAGSEGIAGYVDIEQDDKHIFFWAFESRNDPANDPVILWMTGGPGCSGVGAGMLIELGPCLIDTETGKTRFNPYAWNNNATVIFVDQPVNVGFSYSSHHVYDLESSTNDMHNFLRLFFHAYPRASKLDFYIAGESYGGTWVPTLANRIATSQESKMAVFANARPPTAGLPRMKLKGVILGNVVINDVHQWKGFYPTACSGSGLLNHTYCDQMAAAMPRCEVLLRSCRDADFDMQICGPVLKYCRENSFFLLFKQHPNINMYNFEQECETTSGLCYKAEDIAKQYLSTPQVKQKLGVPTDVDFEICNMDINSKFTAIGDTNRGSEPALSNLLEMGLDVLMFVGSSDWTCNAAGMEYMVNELPWKGMVPFREAAMKDWGVRLESAKKTGSADGTTLTKIGRGKSHGQLTFLEIPHAGHMVPMDRPAEAVEMVSDWLNKQINWL